MKTSLAPFAISICVCPARTATSPALTDRSPPLSTSAAFLWKQSRRPSFWRPLGVSAAIWPRLLFLRSDLFVTFFRSSKKFADSLSLTATFAISNSKSLDSSRRNWNSEAAAVGARSNFYVFTCALTINRITISAGVPIRPRRALWTPPPQRFIDGIDDLLIVENIVGLSHPRFPPILDRPRKESLCQLPLPVMSFDHVRSFRVRSTAWVQQHLKIAKGHNNGGVVPVIAAFQPSFLRRKVARQWPII